MIRFRAPAALLLGLALFGCDSPKSETSSGQEPETGEIRVDNVILISIDSLRADHLGAYGYAKNTSPYLDDLAAKGVLFEQAYSTTSWTLPSHTALFTGLNDRTHGVRHHKTRLSPAIPTLAEELTKAGIHTVGFYSGPYLHPTFGLARGFAEYRNCSSVVPKAPQERVGLKHFASFKDITNPIILESLGSWVKQREDTKRNFVFIHMWDVHYDYTPPRKYLEMFDSGYSGEIDGGVFRDDRVHPDMDPRDLEHLIARYDGEIRYTDDTIAQLLEMLGAAGLLDNSAVIVVSDHGDEFFEHGGKGHQHTLFNEVLHIPMILHLPGRRAKESRINKVVSLVDVYPTVCDLFGAACELRERAGESLLSFFRDGNDHKSRNHALADLFNRGAGTQKDALVLPRGKALRWQTASPKLTRDWVRRYLPDQPIPEDADQVAVYFDRENALREQRGVLVSGRASDGDAGATVALLADTSKAASEVGERLSGDTTDAETSIDEETTERLRALGYMD